MAEEAIGTPLSVRRPRLGMPSRRCFTTPLVRLHQDKLGTTTPTDQAQDTPRALPLSTNTRKRVGLSRIRTELTKKRLEFPAVSEHKENELTPKSKDNKPLEKEKNNKERKEQDDEQEPQEGKMQDDEKRKIVEDQEDDEEDDQEEMEENDEVEPQDSRIPELQADIETWRRGFIATVNDLQAMVDPRPTKKNMLIHLGIPLEMLRYLEED
ncbi:nucleolar transcription factor 1-B [Drosophila obscura]|uniref:nucleolar transcription factor 1-B n=1 Tax=Drosophila obscura TaxID=7282 RepID=UPI001BB17E50|nr:nucleolar transcription factor 1-B [Drosophila obscura]